MHMRHLRMRMEGPTQIDRFAARNFRSIMAGPQNLTLGLIVEGHGEEQAAPVLVRHIARACGFHTPIKCHVRRVTKSQLVRSRELQRVVEALTRQIGRRQPILILLDADEHCPTELAANPMTRAKAEHADVTISIVVAKQEYEAWFLAAANSSAGQRGLAERLNPPGDPESVRGAKEWLTAHMRSDESYSPTRHQSAFSEMMDLSEARGARSFRKFEPSGNLRRKCGIYWAWRIEDRPRRAIIRQAF